MLPYDQRAAITHNSDALGEVALSVWPLGEPRTTAVGDAWDWTGEAEIEAAAMLVGKANRRLTIEGSGQRFTVISAVKHDFLPHIELRLREISG